MGQCSQGCIKWHSCVCHNNHHNMSFKWITLLAHRDRWGFLIELFCLLLQWVNCALNDKRERDERVAIWMIMGSVSAFVLFFFTFYARKAELADFFFFFSVLMVIQSDAFTAGSCWVQPQSSTIVHWLVTFDQVFHSRAPWAQIRVPLASLFRLFWFSQLGFKLAPFLIPACISNLLDLKCVCVCVIKQLRLYCRHSTVWHVLCRVPVGWALDFTSFSLPRASHVCHAGLLSSREMFFTV